MRSRHLVSRFPRLAAGPNHSALTAGGRPGVPRKGVTTAVAKGGLPTKRRRSSAGPRTLNEPPAWRESCAAEATLWTPRVAASADVPGSGPRNPDELPPRAP
ncbi:hypothetical protein MRX96_025012 [Rhipicephalus microplus]